MIINHDDDLNGLLLTHPFHRIPKHYQTGPFRSVSDCEKKSVFILAQDLFLCFCSLGIARFRLFVQGFAWLAGLKDIRLQC